MISWPLGAATIAGFGPLLLGACQAGQDTKTLPNGIRVLPDEVTHFASSLPADRLIVAYCT